MQFRFVNHQILPVGSEGMKYGLETSEFKTTSRTERVQTPFHQSKPVVDDTTVDPKGNTRFYSLNKNYPLFKELKKIIFKTEGVEGSLRNVLSKYEDIHIAFIYGSYAKNRERKTSDIDLVVVGTFSEDDFLKDIRSLESKLNREINFTSYTANEFQHKRNQKGDFLYEVIKGQKVILKGKLNGK